jgi:hypothetical protein
VLPLVGQGCLTPQSPRLARDIRFLPLIAASFRVAQMRRHDALSLPADAFAHRGYSVLLGAVERRWMCLCLAGPAVSAALDTPGFRTYNGSGPRQPAARRHGPQRLRRRDLLRAAPPDDRAPMVPGAVDLRPSWSIWCSTPPSWAEHGAPSGRSMAGRTRVTQQ